MPQLSKSNAPSGAAFLARRSKLVAFLCLLQMRVPLYQLLQTEARELYRNLRIFPISLALIHSSLSKFRVLHLLPGTKSPPARRFLGQQLRHIELLAAGRKKFGNVVDGVVVRERSRRLGLDPCRIPSSALVFVLVGIVRPLPVWRGR